MALGFILIFRSALLEDVELIRGCRCSRVATEARAAIGAGAGEVITQAEVTRAVRQLEGTGADRDRPACCCTTAIVQRVAACAQDVAAAVGKLPTAGRTATGPNEGAARIASDGSRDAGPAQAGCNDIGSIGCLTSQHIVIVVALVSACCLNDQDVLATADGGSAGNLSKGVRRGATAGRAGTRGTGAGGTGAAAGRGASGIELIQVDCVVVGVGAGGVVTETHLTTGCIEAQVCTAGALNIYSTIGVEGDGMCIGRGRAGVHTVCITATADVLAGSRLDQIVRTGLRDGESILAVSKDVAAGSICIDIVVSCVEGRQAAVENLAAADDQVGAATGQAGGGGNLSVGAAGTGSRGDSARRATGGRAGAGRAAGGRTGRARGAGRARAAGRSRHTGGNGVTEHDPTEFGIVDERVTVALDRLNRVITAHFEGVNRVTLAPAQKRGCTGECLGNSSHGRALHIIVKNDTSAVALDLIQRLKDAVLVVTADNATVLRRGLKGGVAAGYFAVLVIVTRGVCSGVDGTHCVQVAFNSAAAQGVRPAVLTVPRLTGVPSAGGCNTGIMQQQLRGAALVSIGILHIGTQAVVADSAAAADLRTKGRTQGACGLRGQSSVAIATAPIGLCQGRKCGTGGSTLAGVIGIARSRSGS